VRLKLGAQFRTWDSVEGLGSNLQRAGCNPPRMHHPTSPCEPHALHILLNPGTEIKKLRNRAHWVSPKRFSGGEAPTVGAILVETGPRFWGSGTHSEDCDDKPRMCRRDGTPPSCTAPLAPSSLPPLRTPPPPRPRSTYIPRPPRPPLGGAPSGTCPTAAPIPAHRALHRG